MSPYTTFDKNSADPETVRIPMMPKGVEHNYKEAQRQAHQEGENSDDAERR